MTRQPGQILFDSTPFSVVVVCAVCAWRVVAGSRSEANALAERHRVANHPTDRLMANQLRRRTP